jgi:selenium metabolism protein YedF
MIIMRIVDTKGQLCPAPLIAAKRALKETAEGDSFIVLTDNRTSFDNLTRFMRDNRAIFNSTEEGGVWKMTITRTSLTSPDKPVEEYCETGVAHFEKGDFIVSVSSDKMGDGDPELGHLLIVNFIKALKDLDTLPSKILFYNKGVMLATTDSKVIDQLEDLQKMGVEIHLCATCVNYYNLAEKVRVGIISDMFVIAQAMASAGHIIKP